jgi:iron complex transport system substrate-binding protein
MHYWKIGRNLLVSLIRLYLISLTWGWLLHTAHAREVIDFFHTVVNVPSKPLRIITLMPSLGELVADLLGDDLSTIIAVSEATDYPPKLKFKPKVGPYHRLNLETILSMHPDLILASADGNRLDQVKHLRELGLAVVSIDTETFADIEKSMKLVALALGKPLAGEEMARAFSKKIGELKTELSHRPTRKVMLQVGDEPLVVVGRKSFLESVLEILGAQNIYQDLNERYPMPSIESVVQRDPEVIVIFAMHDDLKFYEKMQRRWELFKTMKAVHEHKIKVVQCDSLLRPTMRLLEGMVQLDRAIYD